MAKTIKIKFKTDYSPRKKGELVELEEKLANHYLSIGVAEIPCSGCEDKPCSECEKLAKANESLIDSKKELITDELKPKTKKK